jgi:2-polyprenyl-3-methyl-5-hydroxy-6-metoxy-1,4-benzoquinol methylase
MRRIDRALRDWRIGKALPWIPDAARVLDVGCFDGALFHRLGARLGYGVGLDPAIEAPSEAARFRLVGNVFPDVPAGEGRFDAITFLAVLEHVETSDIDAWTRTCHDLLVDGGVVIATIPSPRVDTLLDIGIRLRVLDGMEAGQHHGVDPDAIVTAFERADFVVERHERFQLGLNNLYVLRRASERRV